MIKNEFLNILIFTINRIKEIKINHNIYLKKLFPNNF